ncbi:MAG: hypothetical protein Q4D82_01470 [Neisseria sp.]|nr:hypothetical protein [Neisseria sp.]
MSKQQETAVETANEAVENRAIIALKLELEDEQTGALSDYHVLDSYYVSKSGGYVQATFATYVSERAFKRGLHPVSNHIAVTAQSLPPQGEDLEQWLYGLAAGEESALAGAEAVYA